MYIWPYYHHSKYFKAVKFKILVTVANFYNSVVVEFGTCSWMGKFELFRFGLLLDCKFHDQICPFSLGSLLAVFILLVWNKPCVKVHTGERLHQR